MRAIQTYLCGARREYCEDALFASENCAVVIDGATGVTGERVSGAATDALWLAQELCRFFARNAARADSLLSLMRGAARHCAGRYARFPGADAVQDKPSACVTAVREKDGFLEYYSLCDTVLIARKKSGEVLHILDDRLTALDAECCEILREEAKRRGCPVREAFPAIVPRILENRRNMNRKGGYAAFSLTVRGLDTALQGKIPLGELEDVLLFSDGFAEIYDLFGIFPSPEELIAFVAEQGVFAAVRLLRGAQDADPCCERYPRNKLRDDMAVVYAKI